MEPLTVAEMLRLPTIDDTQTAFARNSIFISETTAARWRSAGEVLDELPRRDSPPAQGTCFAMLSRKRNLSS